MPKLSARYRHGAARNGGGVTCVTLLWFLLIVAPVFSQTVPVTDNL